MVVHTSPSHRRVCVQVVGCCSRSGLLKLQKLDVLQVCLFGCGTGLQMSTALKVTLKHAAVGWPMHAALQLLGRARCSTKPLQAAATMACVQREK